MSTFFERFDLNFGEFYNLVSKNRELEPKQEYETLSVDFSDLPLSLDEVKTHLKLDDASSEVDSYYEMLIIAATGIAETCMRRELLNKHFRTYVSRFKEGIWLKRSKLQAITSVSYMDPTGAWNVIDPSQYYVSMSPNYSRLYADPNAGWPYQMLSDRRQSVKIEFTAGYGTPLASICPGDIKLALLNHISVMDAQRGDWGSSDLYSGMMIGSIPSLSNTVYSLKRITNG